MCAGFNTGDGECQDERCIGAELNELIPANFYGNNYETKKTPARGVSSMMGLVLARERVRCIAQGRPVVIK